MKSKQLVSCIMPTHNRRYLVNQSIWYFLRQDYPRRELIIVDDGSDAVADLVPNDERIRYIRLESRHSVGVKRNLACKASRGKLIAHWNDDDWYAPNRLSLQVRALLSSKKDVCGAGHLLFYDLMVGTAWRYHYPANRQWWLAGSTLLYRRSAWAAHRFPDRNAGQDTAFVRQFAPDRLHKMTDSSFAVAIIHKGKRANKSLRGLGWQRRPLSEITQLLAVEKDFYVALRNGCPYSLNLNREFIFRRAMKKFLKAPQTCIQSQNPVINELIYGWGNEFWGASREYLVSCIEQALRANGPILECGSGLSTILVGAIAKRRGLSYWAFEHIPRWATKVQRYLDRYHIDSVLLCTKPLKDYGAFSWYDPPLESLPDRFDLVICDGPPSATQGGRFGLVPIMRERLKSGCTILLDDAERKQELAIAKRWMAMLDASCKFFDARPYIKITVMS